MQELVTAARCNNNDDDGRGRRHAQSHPVSNIPDILKAVTQSSTSCGRAFKTPNAVSYQNLIPLL